jgi:hypothetical protein
LFGDNDIDLLDLANNTIDDAGKFAYSVYGLKERKAILPRRSWRYSN